MNKPYTNTLPNDPLEIEVTDAGYEPVQLAQNTPIDLTDLDASPALLDAHLNRNI